MKAIGAILGLVIISSTAFADSNCNKFGDARDAMVLQFVEGSAYIGYPYDIRRDLAEPLTDELNACGLSSSVTTYDNDENKSPKVRILFTSGKKDLAALISQEIVRKSIGKIQIELRGPVNLRRGDIQVIYEGLHQ